MITPFDSDDEDAILRDEPGDRLYPTMNRDYMCQRCGSDKAAFWCHVCHDGYCKDHFYYLESYDRNGAEIFLCVDCQDSE